MAEYKGIPGNREFPISLRLSNNVFDLRQLKGKIKETGENI
jgi:hypothetical protein